MADNTTAEDTVVTFNVKASSGPKVTVSLPLTTTVADLKTKLAEPDMANVPASSQRLIYSGKVLKDHETLGAHNVKEGNTMHLVRSAASNQRQNPASQNTPADTGSTTTTAPAANVPQNFAAGTGNDPLVGLTGARYAGFAGLPSLQELANPPSPEEMMRRLQDPNFAQMMNEALSNPQMIDMMINSSPQLRAMGPQARQWLQSDYFRRMLTNPDTMRQMIEMQRMMGGSGAFGMGGGSEAFPMPGATNTTEGQDQNQTQNQGQGQGQGQQQQNPFAGMLGGGMNPFMFMPPPPPGQDRSADPSNNADTQAFNPFAALFNPAPAQTQPGQQQPGQTGSDSNNSSQQPNPFAANPLMAGMMNNPQMQQMMNNPEMLQNAMQMMLGGGAGAGGLGNFGNFGGPPDNRAPEERYATQLGQLNEMGFYNFDQNIQALSRSGGDVNGALEWLFSQPPS
ncbi:hypothetical protein LTR05_001836 [Lithohypha guttulata]|uniref:Uncharacterized protein n=1 Tax=Lithohypha guttulata TaxID=1690604 RepID=A0AAN7YLT6_9EURO|nr:hypothetical protein LTR05_001836 [Lithohypha guttulata]